MSLIDLSVSADLKAATEQLRRIADCLVALLRTQGIHIEPLKADTTLTRDREELSYATDETTFKHDLLDARDGRDPFRPVDVEDV